MTKRKKMESPSLLMSHDEWVRAMPTKQLIGLLHDETIKLLFLANELARREGLQTTPFVPDSSWTAVVRRCETAAAIAPCRLSPGQG